MKQYIQKDGFYIENCKAWSVSEQIARERNTEDVTAVFAIRSRGIHPSTCQRYGFLMEKNCHL